VGAMVSVGAGGGAIVDVGGSINVGVKRGSVVGVSSGGRIPVGVGVGSAGEVGEVTCDEIGVAPFDVDAGDFSVLMAVKKTGVIGVTVGVPAATPSNGQPCNATGNNRQLDCSEQIFKLNVVNCVPLQTSTRLPFRTSAVRQVTEAVAGVSTSKTAKSGKMRTA
jgi:hypothetical protein